MLKFWRNNGPNIWKEKKAAANNIFAPGGVDVWLKILLSLLRFVPGTGRSSKFPPDRKYSRYGQFAGTSANPEFP
jgi:hypothetical protein